MISLAEHRGDSGATSGNSSAPVRQITNQLEGVRLDLSKISSSDPKVPPPLQCCSRCPTPPALC